MLTNLQIKNFKGWKDSGPIRLAPLTVFFGTNSAGKSSIPQILLMMKQTAESQDRKRALQLGDNRTYADLGTLEDVLHNHDLNATLQIALEWRVDPPQPLGGGTVPLTIAKGISFDVSIRAPTGQPEVEEFSYTLTPKGAGTAPIQLGMKRKGDSAQYDLTYKNFRPVRQPGRAWPLPPPVRFYGFPDEATAYYKNTTALSDVVLRLEQALRSIYYLGPLREYPRRLYLWSGEVPDHVGAKGERTIEALLAGGRRTFNWGPKQRKVTLATAIADWLLTMGLIADFQVKALGPNRKEHEVLVRTRKGAPQVKLTDVGFGVSQVLPVLVECFYVPPGSTVIFEQPEIHLHPRVQGDLADLFIDASMAREVGVPRNCQFLIESHSEHFLRRLQRRIAEGKVSPEDAAIYFVDSADGRASLHALDVDLYGNILNWPENFFGDEMEDLVARTEAQAKRMTQATPPEAPHE